MIDIHNEENALDLINKTGFVSAEIPADLDLHKEIHALKKQKNAVILAHYYQNADIQDIADFIGDSLGLAQQAQRSKADTILFAGYINCSAEIKAMSDIICTSSNAQKIVESFPKDQPLIFAPDKNLGAYINRQTNRQMLLWNGACMVHEIFSEQKLLKLKFQHPQAQIIAHPECETHVLSHADFIGSTTQLLEYTKKDDHSSYIVVTETGIIHQMEASSPEKTFIPAPPENACACNDCPHMKLNTMEKIYLALRYEQPELLMNVELMKKAELPLQRMLDLS